MLQDAQSTPTRILRELPGRAGAFPGRLQEKLGSRQNTCKEGRFGADTVATASAPGAILIVGSFFSKAVMLMPTLITLITLN